MEFVPISDYTYCLASNKEEPEYLGRAPKWAESGEAQIGEPVGCPKCQAWGVDNFKTVN